MLEKNGPVSPVSVIKGNNNGFVILHGNHDKPANWMRSAYDIGPPLEYESISFFASSIKLNAAARFLFSGLLISELQKEKKHKKKKETSRWF